MQYHAELEQLKIDEGFHDKDTNPCERCGCPTDPLGIATIGYGRNIVGHPITRSEGEYLLGKDTYLAELDAKAIVPSWGQLTLDRKRVLINMSYNLGVIRLGGFKKMLIALRAGAYEVAAEEMLDSKWARQVGDRAERLAERMRHG